MATLPRRVIILGSLFLGACGGGGGGGGDDGNLGGTPPPPQPVQITASNGQHIGGATLAAIDVSTLMSDLVLSLSGEAVGAASAQGGSSARLADASAGLRAHAVAGPVAHAPEACTGGGTVTVDNTIAASGTLTQGDRLSYAFSNCNEDGIVFNGGFSLVVSAYNDDPAPFILEATLTFSQLQLTYDGEEVRLGGAVTVSADTQFNPFIVELTGQSLAVQVNAEASTLSNFTLTVATDVSDPDDWNYSRMAEGVYTSTAIGGQVAIETIAPLLQSESQTFPADGQIEIIGANRSGLLISDMDSPVDGVTLDFDLDGDGEYEFPAEPSVDTTWPELLP